MVNWNEVKQVFMANVELLMWENGLCEDGVEMACHLHPGFFAEIRSDSSDFIPSEEDFHAISVYLGKSVEFLLGNITQHYIETPFGSRNYLEIVPKTDCEDRGSRTVGYSVRYRRYLTGPYRILRKNHRGL